MKFAVFFQVDLAGKLSPVMGSDSYCPIDGRYSLERSHLEALAQVERLRPVKPWIVGYQIRQGSISSSSPLTHIYHVPGKREEFIKAKKIGLVPW